MAWGVFTMKTLCASCGGERVEFEEIARRPRLGLTLPKEILDYADHAIQ